jgi:GNAT superfamily N-acetyltransferase
MYTVHYEDTLLVRVNEPNGGPAPRFFLGQTADGVVRRYRQDIADDLRRELEAASAPDRLGHPAADAPLDPAPYASILARAAPVERTSVGLALRFPAALAPAPDTRLLADAAGAALLHPLLPEWMPDVRHAQPLIARVFDGRAVAVCCSVCITPRAHEAGVETAAACRGRGYAAAVVTTWAAAVREQGAEPIYSAVWQNVASRAVARKLGLVPIGRDLHIT